MPDEHDEHFRKLMMARAGSMTGTWSGHAHQINGICDLVGKSYIVARIQTNEKDGLEGDFIYLTQLFSFRAIMQTTDLVKIEHIRSDLRAIQFGFSLLKIDATGTRLNGALVGYGPLSDSIVQAELNLYAGGIWPTYRDMERLLHAEVSLERFVDSDVPKIPLDELPPLLRDRYRRLSNFVGDTE